jgi:hypothetical protein
MARLQNIRQKIIDRRYFLSSHAEEELQADGLERADVEHAILKGRIDRRYSADPRGVRYRLAGPARDGRAMCVLIRFHEVGDLIIITVYEKNASHEM